MIKVSIDYNTSGKGYHVLYVEGDGRGYRAIAKSNDYMQLLDIKRFLEKEWSYYGRQTSC
jgi:hypothetical protein